MHITFYRKYRPKSFEEVYGEENIIKTIKNSLKENRIAHAYLFTGPRGVGKTTTARLIAKGLNCLENGMTDNPCNTCENCLAIDKGNFFDLIEIDAASNRGIDEIRELKDKINYQPVKGRKKVYIIDEVHMLTKEAFNALLKTLEEPPEHVVFILATTEPDKILDTIISRCQRYDFEPISFEEIKLRLEDIAKKEDINIDEKSLELIYKKCGGSLRDAISIFEKVATYYYKDEITSEKTEVALGVIPEKKLREFLEIVSKEDIKSGTKFLDGLWEHGINIEDFFKEFAFMLKDMVVKGQTLISPDKSIIIIETIYEVISIFKYEEDKRLLGYIILYKIVNKKEEKAVVEKIVYKEIKSENTSNTETESPQVVAADFESIKKDWENIVAMVKDVKISFLAFLANSKPLRMENGKLVIGLPKESAFHQRSLEKKENMEILKGVLKERFKESININYEVIGEKKDNKKSDNFVNDILEFFDGEIID